MVESPGFSRGSVKTEYLKDKSEETVGTYHRSLRAFEKWFIQHHGRFCFPEDDVRAHRQYLMEEPELSQVSVFTYHGPTAVLPVPH